MKGTAEAIMRAIAKDITARQDHLDGASDIGEVTIMLRLKPGTTTIRSLTWREERVIGNLPERRTVVS